GGARDHHQPPHLGDDRCRFWVEGFLVVRHRLHFLFTHNLIRKPVPTFRDYARAFDYTIRMPATETVTITAEEQGQRRDRVLAARIPSLSRSRLKALILAGQVAVAARTIRDPASAVNAGDTVTVTLPPPEPAQPKGEAIPLNVV